ncbi:response regulator transcription factor [Cohnella sp. REN36]|uniref:response regulator transcription factor n=1 Tax=Cohnella sp. REN36 TaxID=2887347 RepID=UPI001D1439DE|nr:response regulator transcription factor [Cohnella sp. REN36]MCC3373096.1 response regulator transcription factor [Cohnella sp. REN36]
MTKILIIEDDPIVGEMLTLYLAEEGFEVRRVETARAGFRELETYSPDVLILDLVLPDAEGTELCAQFRQHSQVPMIVTSMKTAVADRIQAISSGADDYLCKPFSMQELKVRIQALLRRTLIRHPHGGDTSGEAADAARISLDTERRTILLNGQPIETTFSEYEMMKLFCQHPGRVFTREELLNAVRGIDSIVSARAMDVHITHLRRKLEDNPKEPRHIKTVWGVGYKFLY